MMNNVGIVGTCLSMCPEAEIKERERAGLIHVLEKCDDQQQPVSVSRGGSGRGPSRNNQRGVKNLVKADKNKTIKAYTRPAAGINKSNPSDLRPSSVLKKTVAYLSLKVLTRTDLPFIDIYDYVFDRLRAVRQDMVIQRMSDESAIIILETIVKFHVYAEYCFRKNASQGYDPVINQRHLRDCLKTLLSLYEINSFNGSTRPFFEALYCLNSPDSYEVISRAFAIKSEMETSDSTVFNDALQVCLAIQKRNYYKFFQLLQELPPLLAGYAIQQVNFMRTHALRAISISYGVKTCKVPLEWIEEILCYPDLIRAHKDLIRIGCEIIASEENADKFVKFDKSCSFAKTDINNIAIDTDVKPIILSGLSNLDVIAREQLCPWGQHLA